ncbi:MAG: protein kinase [Myxococcales bacterium]|nr:protein kinase [Myxococcales bacterium]
MSTPNNLQIRVHPGRGGCLIAMEGVVDEAFDGARLIDAARGVAVIDLDRVRRITSFGVREWVKTVRQLSADYLGFVRCRPALVTQFNTVADFAGRGELLSFYAPYVCGQCAKEVEVLVDVRRQHDEVMAFKPPEVTCPHCQSRAEFDDLPESYFAFAAAAQPPNPPPLVDSLLSGSPPMGVAFKVEKDVEGTVTALWFSGDLDRTAFFKRLADGLEGKVILLAERVEQVTAEGVTRLKAFLMSADAEVFLARLPLRLARELVRAAGTCGRARVLSVRLPFQCESCSVATPTEVDLDTVKDVDLHRPFPTSCPECSGPLTALFGEAELRACSTLPWARAPEEVADYLSRNRVRQTRSGPDEDKTATGQVFGRYLLLRPLGAGGMAEVFLARQTGVGGFEKNVVVKRILPHLSADQQFVKMFLDEARMAARVSHPNVVQIFDVGQVGSQYYIAMEYVRGWDLSAILRLCTRLDTPFPLELAARVVADMCAGLHEAHTCTDEHGRSLAIVHRDVSPHNVLVSTGGQVKVADFGIAKAVDSSNRTPTSMLKGKLSYMSPEQVRPDAGPVDARTDIFSAGLILYQCLTLEHMFRRETEFATLKAILHDPVPRVSARRPEAPPELEGVIDRALSRGVEQRYPTALAFQQDLEWCIASTAKTAGPADLAAWLKALVKRGESMGQLPPDMSFTPTSQLGSNRGTGADEQKTITTKVLPAKE